MSSAHPRDAAQTLADADSRAPLSYQFSDRFSTQIDGGVLVYYVSAQPGKITAFKPGFRMLVGDSMRRTKDTSVNMKRQNCFRCYTGPNFGGDVSAPCQDGKIDTEALPAGPCKGGIRSNLHFPTYVLFLPQRLTVLVCVCARC